MAVDVLTFGCRLNAAESAAIKHAASDAGIGNTLIVNTCAVTSEAVAQARQAIRRRKRETPGASIIVTGCAAQIDGAAFSGMAEVDRVVGNAEKLDPATWRTPARIAVGDIMARPPRRVPAFGAGLPRAFVQIQNGCDHRCTFCVIPFGRGPSRSMSPDNVIADVRAMTEQGHAEIVLTGVDITAYDADGLTLGALARRILLMVPDLKRLRISSIDAVEADRDLLALVAEEPRLMPHLHLSLQSGDDMILKRMKRRHSRADAVALCDQLKRLRPDIALGADLIAGFPTETDAMAARSRDLVEECGLTFLHVFPFSPRPGTHAARMPQVSGTVIRERARLLRQAGEAALRRRLTSETGAIRHVLAENATQGRTEHFLPVALTGAKTGSVTPMRITGDDGARLLV